MTKALSNAKIGCEIRDALRSQNTEFVAQRVADLIGGGTAEAQLAAAMVALTRKRAEREYLICAMLEIVIQELEAVIEDEGLAGPQVTTVLA